MWMTAGEREACDEPFSHEAVEVNAAGPANQKQRPVSREEPQYGTSEQLGYCNGKAQFKTAWLMIKTHTGISKTFEIDAFYTWS